MRLLAVALVVLLGAGGADAAEWDTIRPGESRQSAVRGQLGEPSKVSSQKVEGYDSPQWTYEAAQAPRGMIRVTIDFGVLTPQGYRTDVVRQMVVEPKPGVFTRQTVLAGWGQPDMATVEGGKKMIGYRAGLFVYFDAEGWIAERMYFTPPQPPAAGAAPAPR